MPERTLDDPMLWEKLTTWFTERPELLVDVYYPRSGGSSDYYFVFSLDDFRRMIDKVVENCIRTFHYAGAVVTVIHQQQYLFRGLVDEEFIRKAVAHFQGAADLDISEGKAYPKRARLDSALDTTQLEQILGDEWFGSFVRIGP